MEVMFRPHSSHFGNCRDDGLLGASRWLSQPSKVTFFIVSALFCARARRFVTNLSPDVVFETVTLDYKKPSVF